MMIISVIHSVDRVYGFPILQGFGVEGKLHVLLLLQAIRAGDVR